MEALTSSDFEMRQTEVKTLLFDLETSPARVAVWSAYEANALWVDEYPQIICFSAKWLGGKHVTKCLADYDGHDGTLNDLALVTELHSMMLQADVLIGQNSDSFDIKVAKTRFLKHGLPPIPKIASVDTKKVAKREFRLFSNKLDWMGDFLELGHKTEHEGIGLWKKCIEANDQKAWNRMKRYNAQDVKLLEKTYLAMRAWDSYHPNMNVLWNREDGCTKCKSQNIQKRGRTSPTRTGRAQRFQCQDCGAWMQGRHIKTTNTR